MYYDHQAEDQLRGWMPASPWSVMTPVLRTQTASPTETCNYQSGQGGVEVEPHLAGPEQAVVHPEQRALPPAPVCPVQGGAGGITHHTPDQLPLHRVLPECLERAQRLPALPPRPRFGVHQGRHATGKNDSE